MAEAVLTDGEDGYPPFFIFRVQEYISSKLEDLSELMVVDSIPIPVVKMARERLFKAFKNDFETAPVKGYSAANKGCFIGYKQHVVIFDNGVVRQSVITKGNVHDINFLTQIEELPVHK